MQSFLNKVFHNQSTQKPDPKSFEMHSAAAAGKTDVVEALLRIGVDVDIPANVVNPNVKLSPLLTAVDNDKPEVVRLLIQHGASLTGIEGGCAPSTPFQWAQEKGFFKTFAAMIDECTKKKIEIPKFDPIYIIAQAHHVFDDLPEYLKVLSPAQKTLAVEFTFRTIFRHDDLDLRRDLMINLLANSKVTTKGLTYDLFTTSIEYAPLKKLGELLEAGSSPTQALDEVIALTKQKEEPAVLSSPKP